MPTGTNGYARHAEFYVRVAENHPAVVAYSMSHNACGYGEDMNPDKIDGLHDPRSAKLRAKERQPRTASRGDCQSDSIRRGSSIITPAVDLGAMHTVNFYPNFVPIQEMSDWFEHWATVGVKPAFPCEYGAPFMWDWAMYRGWYKGEREFGSAMVPWDFCLAEWNSQFIGDAGVSSSANTRRRTSAGRRRSFAPVASWHRWDYPHVLGSNIFEQRMPIIARYITDNWRAFRTWGLSAFSPWEHGEYWRLRDGVSRAPAAAFRQLANACSVPASAPIISISVTNGWTWRTIVPIGSRTPAAEALLRNNLPLLGYIAGKPEAFTSKDHLFVPGETFAEASDRDQ